MKWILQRTRDLTATAAVVVLWQLIAEFIYPHYNAASQNIFPSPLTVLAIGKDMLENGELLRHVSVSLMRVVAGFALASFVAIPLGLSMGAWRGWGRQVQVIVDVLRPVPPFAWIPFGLLWFGVGDQQSVFVIFIAAVFPILMNTVAGVNAVELVLIRSGLCLGADQFRLFWHVVLPRAIPQILLGMRVGLGFAWMVLVAAEMIGSTSGLGFLISDSRNAGLPSLAFLGMFVIGIIGYLLDAFLRAIERTLTAWR